MSRIIVQLHGGLVQDVFIQAARGRLFVYVVDEDVEGAEPREITKIKIGKGKTYEAAIHRTGLSELPKGSDVDKIIKAYLNR